MSSCMVTVSCQLRFWLFFSHLRHMCCSSVDWWICWERCESQGGWPTFDPSTSQRSLCLSFSRWKTQTLHWLHIVCSSIISDCRCYNQKPLEWFSHFPAKSILYMFSLSLCVSNLVCLWSIIHPQCVCIFSLHTLAFSCGKCFSLCSLILVFCSMRFKFFPPETQTANNSSSQGINNRYTDKTDYREITQFCNTGY